MLRQGGNAMDAAVAAAATLAVAIPHMNGLGGDAIALYYDASANKVTAINGSGRAPAAATVAHYRGLGHEAIPRRGPLSMSVPGVVRAWENCLLRWGSKSLHACLEPAIELAEEGVPIDQAQLEFLTGPVYAELASDFAPLADFFGAPAATRRLGMRLFQPLLSRTLRALAEGGAACFYEGAIAEALLLDLRAAGALISERDLAGHATEFGESLAVSYHGRTVHAAPPNSQGVALVLLAGLDDVTASRRGKAPPAELGLDATWYMRAKRSAFELRDRHAVDPARSRLPPDLLSRESLSRLAGREVVADAEAQAGGGDTSTLVVVDSAGNAVSWVQSLFEEFGSGIVSERTGIVLHNRLHLEQLNDDPSRGLRPGMRPFHTLCPALVVGRRGCDMAIATPGDHGQPQTIYQVLRHVFVDAIPIQDAIERPRLRHDLGEVVMMEDRAPASWRDDLQASGYSIRDVGSWSRLMGGVNAVHRLSEDVWSAGADPRRSSYAVTRGR
ncbi:MAG: gamma-glutamyltransferase family protein [Rhodospirillales bacterium]|nr:gamma-glutamyltransferase family protein [Rhodospirillales bacterium]MDH3835065.1 gamma-glutamyltransferase family protein [Nitrosopumilus sp.]MDH3918746.1 gamma-glutamyltransferase family protein [Rhodospirillales bacterium]MDH3969592.1 gamma-glutamyltransferase family protein [Rhodospirillales bacterium]